MHIQLYNNSGGPRQLSKNIISVGQTFEAQLSASCTVEEPELLFDMNNNYISANYLYISEWERYYYIRERNIENGNQIRIKCHVDVLMSFRNAILNSQCIAERATNKVNPYIEDPVCGDAGSIQTEYRRSPVTPFGYSSNNYVLQIAGR